MKSYQKPDTILWETSSCEKIECHGKKIVKVMYRIQNTSYIIDNFVIYGNMKILVMYTVF